MQNQPPKSVPNSAGNSTGNRAAILKEVQAKWGKFSEQELSGLKNRDELVTQLQAKYSLDKAHAQRDADGLLKGRAF
jgi:hypothetical protein